MTGRKTSSLKTEIYQSIMQDIIEGVYRQNEIINEKNLIEKYGVSKSPIRDALIELCSEGVLISHPRYGYEVVRINEKEIRDIIDYRVMIESGCLRSAAERMSHEDIQELRQFTQEECFSDIEETSILEHWENNSRFHMKLLSYSGNEYCCAAVKKSVETLTRAYAQRHWEKWGKISCRMDCKNHMKIIDYLEENKIEKAVAELTKDIQSFLELMYYDYSPRRI